MDTTRNNNDHNDIELRSEEVQEIMNRIPNAFLHYGMTVIIVVILLLVGGSILFSYPEVVEGKCIIQSVPSTAKIYANHNGYIDKVIVPSDCLVSKDDVVATLQSDISYDIVCELISRVSRWLDSGAKIVELESVFFHRYTDLGQFQTLYDSMYGNWMLYVNNPTLENNHAVFRSVSDLKNELEKYSHEVALYCPIGGRLKYMCPIHVGQVVSEGELICVVEPVDSVHTYGYVYVPSSNIELIEVGQQVQIVLETYPENTFGYIIASVSHISPIPDTNGFYVIGITLPEQLQTSYHFEIPSLRECSATARIITKNRSLFSRLINLKI